MSSPAAASRRDRAPPTRHPAIASRTLTHWGHLRVLERIGRGAFGEVYRAWDTRLDREVALKLLAGSSRPATAPRRPSSTRADCSPACAIRTSSPSTAPSSIDDASAVDGVRAGPHARTDRRRRHVFSAGRSGRDRHRGRHAVAAVHAAGLLHRDIKAQNVMLADDGRVVLMDFGTGRELADDYGSMSPGHRSISRLRSLPGGDATVQSDIYSLGVLLYYLVTGSYPVRGGRLSDLRLRPPTQRTMPADGSRALGRICRRSSRGSSSARSIHGRSADMRAPTRWRRNWRRSNRAAGRPAAVRDRRGSGRPADRVAGMDAAGRRVGSSRTPGALLAASD